MSVTRVIYALSAIAWLLGVYFTAASPIQLFNLGSSLIMTPQDCSRKHQVIQNGNHFNNSKEQVFQPSFKRRPIYAIAHRVLTTVNGMEAAVKHGANALEIDMWAWDSWGYKGRPGAKAEDMFRAIQRQRHAGNTINFIWLDLKKPDEFATGKNANKGLRDLAHQYLKNYNVRIMYGFMRKDVDGRSFQVVSKSLITSEAISVNNVAEKVYRTFEKVGQNIPVSKRVIDYGYFGLGFQFGICYEDGYYTCAELRKGARCEKRESSGEYLAGLFKNQANIADKLLSIAQVDGLIYGRIFSYKDSQAVRAPLNDIKSWIATNNEAHLPLRKMILGKSGSAQYQARNALCSRH
ncbi:uncharacterized protein P174DRAFT_436204 [Aspergillus novofumigatus IBT 16806]|uniref:Phospholipase D n=1 Tax=Aspergillus novofumigatus (strain IBT 16806) TaxID=1392255 RepID=A0A2I1BSS8_ASPN1|nr:uncharacterized protein P174DRAFT_436204 [Aspergillus novofumigatus IBT 16806]PKX88448.1 hypothetical protein P174DRAFT_436204 [Aspergillus novofumigatus IBT 16806]